MDIILKEEKLALNAPDDVVIYDKKDVAKLFSLDKDQAEACLLVLGDPQTGNVMTINKLGTEATEGDFSKSIYFVTTELEKQGNKLVKENLLTANDPNHYLQAMIFKNKSYFSVIIVELYKENIYQSSIQCQELEKAYDFSLKIMQSFTKP